MNEILAETPCAEQKCEQDTMMQYLNILYRISTLEVTSNLFAVKQMAVLTQPYSPRKRAVDSTLHYGTAASHTTPTQTRHIIYKVPPYIYHHLYR